jgi:hypothetical protein
VLVERRGSDEVFFAEGRLDAATFKMTLSAVALDAAGRARKTGTGIPFDRLFNG